MFDVDGLSFKFWAVGSQIRNKGGKVESNNSISNDIIPFDLLFSFHRHRRLPLLGPVFSVSRRPLLFGRRRRRLLLSSLSDLVTVLISTFFLLVLIRLRLQTAAAIPCSSPLRD